MKLDKREELGIFNQNVLTARGDYRYCFDYCVCEIPKGGR